MKAKEFHPILGGKNLIKKIWIIIMIMVILCFSFGIYVFDNYTLGYKYYELQSEAKTEVTIGYEKNYINIFEIVENYLDSLEKQGFYIVSHNINHIIYNKFTVVPKKEINNDNVEKFIIQNIEINIFSKKVILDGESFYFKNTIDKDNFITRIEEIDEYEYSESDEIINLNKLSKKESLNSKIEELKNEKQKKEAEKQKQYQVTSRGGSFSRKTNKVTSSPLKTYVYISSYYGMRNGKMHTGVDFAAAKGTPILAWKSGTVTKACYSGGYGNFIIIKHNDGTVSRYAHLSGYNCSVGDSVSTGETIGFVGSTGNSTGNHLHFEIQVNGQFVNPLNYLK